LQKEKLKQTIDTRAKTEHKKNVINGLTKKTPEQTKELANCYSIIEQCNKDTEKLKQQIRINEAKIKQNGSWNDIRLESFSIYLLKPGTTEAEINNPSNKLLLFTAPSKNTNKRYSNNQ
jgi:hypothetical protein